MTSNGHGMNCAPSRHPRPPHSLAALRPRSPLPSLEYAGQLAYETSRKAWMTYANGLWMPTDTEYIQQRIASYMDALLHENYSWGKLSGSVEHLLGRRLAQTLTLETPGWLPFRNGALHLETMTLRPTVPTAPLPGNCPALRPPSSVSQDPSLAP